MENILEEHEYGFGFDTNCRCGAPGIWYWEDWIEHITPLLTKAASALTLNANHRCYAKERSTDGEEGYPPGRL